MRRYWLLRLLPVLTNQEEVWAALAANMPLPPFELPGKMILQYLPEDEPEYVLWEVFIARVYSGERFYTPSRDDTVIDCGANIGAFAIWLAACAKGITVHCFEPVSGTRARLETNIQINNLEDTITVYPYGIWSCCCSIEMKSTWASGHRSFYVYDKVISEDTERCECIDLAKAYDLCGTYQVDLLKIDVEGAESNILEGATTSLLANTKHIIVEYHDYISPGSSVRVISHLLRCGFRICNVSTGSVNRPAGMIYARRS